MGGLLGLKLSPDKYRSQFSDDGPGIEDIYFAMRPGYSTASEVVRELGFGAGMGLVNIHAVWIPCVSNQFTDEARISD
jgi:anti-sigma regulatory factor (Ser/Thr protein kinase)